MFRHIQSWVFIGRTDVEAETPILWTPDAKNWLTRKDPDAGKDWGREEKGTTEDEMVGWTWVWVNSRNWWWTGRPGVLQPMRSQSRQEWATELNWTELRGIFDCHRLACVEVLLAFIAKRPVVLNVLQGTRQPWQPRIVMPPMLMAVLLRNTGNSWPKFCTMPPFGRWWMTEIL